MGILDSLGMRRSLLDLERVAPPAHPWVESYRSGVLHVVFPKQAKDSEVERFCQELVAFFQRMPEGAGLLIDLRRINLTSGAQRQTMNDFRKRVAPIVNKKVIAGAYLADNAMTRGVLAAVLLLRPPEYKYRTFPEQSSAERWLSEQMRAHASGEALRAQG